MANKKKIHCVEFVIWVDGEKVRACSHIGEMVRIALHDRVIGLKPSLSDTRDHLSVGVLRWKRSKKSKSPVKVVDRFDVPFGKKVSSSTEPIKFSAKPCTESLRRQKKAGQCCVTITYIDSHGIKRSFLICASCFVKHGTARCCTSLPCCLELIGSVIFG